ncbi:hypothetical protein C8035_v003545 [Colletotrichum spinosum]|uniref:Pep1 n=1 Tax=Colletotrichum spinosum TaxID=1347390 RepID=A0A4R8Q042_9PEZI|nr:hypothetical protein C8035_v003545 [Colletotrichum spinosum]
MQLTLLATLLPGALAALAAPSVGRRAEWTTTTEPIDLSTLGTIELYSQNPNPQALALRQLQDRSSASATICRGRRPLPRSGAKWLFNEATCDRTGTDVNTFKVSCVAELQHADIIYRLPGACGPKQWCVEFHGYNEISQAAWDVTCVDKSNIHTWVKNAFSSGPSELTSCSAGWNNRGKTNLKATFETDVMDAGGINRIAPQEVFYQLNGKRIGVSRGRDSEVGSGSVIIPPGGSIQACVTAFSGQVINMLGAVTSLVSV